MILRGITFFILISSLFLQSCSDINDGKAKGRLKDQSFPDCAVDPDSFELLLEKPIQADIECAYEKINWLIQSVKEETEESDNRRLSKEDLKLSIENREPEAVKVLEYLDLFFDLNHFVVGSDEGLIIEKDFRALRDFLIVLNREFSKVYKYFSEELRSQETLYNIHYNSMNQILSTVRYIVLEAKTASGEDVSLKGLMSRHPEIKRSIDLSALFDILKVEEGQRSWVFLKRLLIGGNPSVITNDEFYNFLYKEVRSKDGTVESIENKILKTTEVGYNLYRQLKLKFDSAQKRYFFQKENYELAKELVYRKCVENCNDPDKKKRVFKDDTIFTIKEIADWFNYFFKDDLVFSGKRINLKNYEWELARIKKIFIGNDSPDISYDDVGVFFDMLGEITDIGADFSQLFVENKELMLDESARIISKTKIKPVKELESKDNYENFRYVLRTFRYFKGNKRMPDYSNKFHRDNKSLILYGQFEYLLRKAAKFYEKEYPCDVKKTYYIYNFETGKKEPQKLYHDYYCSYGYHGRTEDYKSNVELGQLYFIILEFRQLFRDVGIIDKGDEDKAAENAQTIPDLFIYAANDDNIIQVSELLEFFFGIFSAVEIKNDVVDQLHADPLNTLSSEHVFSKVECRVVDLKNGEPRYDASCIRDNFYTFLLQETRHGDKHFDSLPSLEKFYEERRSEPGKKALRRYILLLESYTKTCSYDNIPYTESDIMGIYTGMYSIESTIGKFDVDGDNILSPTETKRAYEHFYYGLEAIVLEELKGEAKVTDKNRKRAKTKVGRFFKKIFKGVGNFSLELAVKFTFKYLVKYKKLPLPIGKNLLRIGSAGIGKFPKVGREGIANILVILMDLTEPKRQIRYERAGRTYVPPEESCKEELPAGETELLRNEWVCLFDGKCP